MHICSIFLFLHSEKTKYGPNDGPNSPLGHGQVDQFGEDYWKFPAGCSDSWGALWSYQALWCQLFERGEPVQSQSVRHHLVTLFASYLKSPTLPLQWAYGMVII